MRNIRRITFEERVEVNREQLLKDPKALERLEEKWEARRMEK